MMKRIFLGGILGLFICTLFIISPQKVVAVQDCNDHAIWNWGDIKRRSLPPDSGVCDPDNECQYQDPPPGGGSYACIPRGVTTYPPICPYGYGEPVDLLGRVCSNYIGQCCKTDGIFCLDAAGNKIQTGVCDEALRDRAVWETKTACSDPKTTYKEGLGCVQIVESEWQLNLVKCKKADGGETDGVKTAIGCIPTGDLPSTLAFVLKFALGIAGGVILLLLIATGYTLLTSAGNPEKLQAVRENIVSIISGLVLIVFSIVLLQAIGGGILKLPSF